MATKCMVIEHMVTVKNPLLCVTCYSAGIVGQALSDDFLLLLLLLFHVKKISRNDISVPYIILYKWSKLDSFIFIDS